MLNSENPNPNPNPNPSPKKGPITEEDIFTILHRYSATTILTLLKEVSEFDDVKINWNELMEKTETGIKNAREYQMLWRHLAYRQPLDYDVLPHDQPLDDDSDLEYELEASTLVSSIDAAEVSNCVKALTSGPGNKSCAFNNSSCGLPRASSENDLVQKQVQAAGTFGENAGGNGSTSNNQKKRKSLYLGAKDLELIASRKRESIGERNTSQRVQRGNNTKKKQVSSSDGRLSEAQLATRRALDMAFMMDNPSIGCGTVKLTNSLTGSSSKLFPQKKALPQSSISADPIEAAAVAAGARIGSASDKSALLKAAQSKDALHFGGATSAGRTSIAGISSALPPNVHLIGIGPTKKPTSASPPVLKATATSTERVTDV